MTSILIRTVILYIFVAIGLRIMGKRQIGDMQPSELVITIMISEIAAIPIQDLNSPIAHGVIAIMALIALEIILSFFLMKSNTFRRILSGQAAIIIKDGEIDQKVMKAMRLTVDDLIEDLRQQSIFDIREVSFAVVETNGKLSVLKKPEAQNPTSGDLGLNTEDRGMPVLLVSDGKIVADSLKVNGETEGGIKAWLHERRLKLKDIFIMTGDKKKNYSVIKKDK